ncbi:MAG: HU family DNA-binding protein [Bryobacterales bacterium]|nr:HU family DNA-binding protein [Bryobacteraceae bacterium]MDW8356017.1 HU family DNA-binding protein [Bryobacterales bacterium]
MNKAELARRIARQAKLTEAAAADRLDRVLHRILKELKKGRPVTLPDLGTLAPGRKARFRLTPQKDRSRAKQR